MLFSRWGPVCQHNCRALGMMPAWLTLLDAPVSQRSPSFPLPCSPGQVSPPRSFSSGSCPGAEPKPLSS